MMHFLFYTAALSHLNRHHAKLLKRSKPVSMTTQLYLQVGAVKHQV